MTLLFISFNFFLPRLFCSLEPDHYLRLGLQQIQHKHLIVAVPEKGCRAIEPFLGTYVPVPAEIVSIDPDNSFLEIRHIQKSYRGAGKLPLKKIPFFPGFLFDDLSSYINL